MAGLLIYKPHFVVGLLLVWLVWRQWKSIACFTLAALIISGGVLLSYGVSPYLDYFRYSSELIYLSAGAPGAETTLFTLVASLLPEAMLPLLWKINLGFIFVAVLSLGWLAYRAAKIGKEQDLVLGITILFPFVIAPHTLSYDLVLLIPALLLWSRNELSQTVLWSSIALYLGVFLVLAISNLLDVSLLAFLPLGLTILLVHRLLNIKRTRDGYLAGAT